MPWKHNSVIEERMRFVSKWLEGEWSMAALCRQFAVSRKTGYKLARRYEAEGPGAFHDRSRAPHRHPKAIPDQLATRLLAARKAHPTWGPRKLRAWLERCHPRTQWPAPSAIGAVLKREGLTVRRRRCVRTPPYTQPFASCQSPNAVWCADFKGWFRTGDGKVCYPFTLSDAYSRFLLRCQALPATDLQTVFPVLQAAFREFGLPAAMRTDNGPPFASTGLAGLSRLSIWWVKLGIKPERIDPGRPEQNGRHERLHATLNEAITPPRANRRQQQRAFDAFRGEFNDERPHEALGQRPPASVYTPSSIPYPLQAPQIEYPDDMELRRVRHSGEIRWRGRQLYLCQTLAGERVGLLPVDDQHWKVYFGPLELATLDCHKWKVLRPRRASKPRPVQPVNTSKQVSPMSQV